MNIGITCHPTTGGSGIVATDLGVALAQRGHTVHFVTDEPPFRLNEFHENIVCHSLDLVSYPMLRRLPYSLVLATKIAEVADEHRIDLWHAHYAIPYAASAILAGEMLNEDRRFKLVTTLHGTDITLVGNDPSYFRLIKFAMERSDAITAVSDWLREETEREFGLENSVKTIYNFLDGERFTSASPERCKLAEADEKIIMHISNFRPVKRVTDVIRAFKKITDRVHSRLIMVGEGPERTAAVGVARQLGVADHVKYLGNNVNIEQLLPCADLVFQPSEHESFGMVPLEAMACEVPVIGTASGGVREVVEDGVTGYLCEVGDTDTMAERAIEILSDPERGKEMGRAGRARGLRLFAKDKIVAEYENLYSELVT